MANRRMFSMDIVDSDAFLDMSISAQCLYFHLSMRADDDGFVSNPKKVMRICGGNDDDYKMLIAKRFVIVFESGVCVIKHWKIHNYIRKDTYNPTRYVEEKSRISIKDNGSYTDRQRSVDGSSTQVRLGKVSIDIPSTEVEGGELSDKKDDMSGFNKYSDDYLEGELQIDPDYKPKAKKEKKDVPDEIQQVFDLFDNPARKVWRLREIERESARALYEAYGIETLKRRMELIKEKSKNNDPMFPLIVTPSQLLDKMPNVERYLNV